MASSPSASRKHTLAGNGHVTADRDADADDHADEHLHLVRDSYQTIRSEWSLSRRHDPGSYGEPTGDDGSMRPSRWTRRGLVRYASFACAIVSCLCAGSITAYSVYGHLFLSRLRYTQLQVNMVSIAAELAMYLPVPFWGYQCDRYSPGSASLVASLFFGSGYLLAAFTYHQGPPPSAGGDGWPFAAMVVAFVGIGAGTSCMYISAVTTCAKNFGRGKHKGFALAVPIAAFGLSGMWLSQIGSRVWYEVESDGHRRDVNVFHFFLFLCILLAAVGVLGFFGLQIVDGDDLIDEAVDELERSGLLEDSTFFPPLGAGHDYGAVSDSETVLSKNREDEERRKKTWLLNGETKRFLTDHTMWWLAVGFLLVTGPGEAFINNLGTIIGTLYPPSTDDIPTSAATHVSIVAVTSTLARIVTGTVSDLLAPASEPHHYRHMSSSQILPPRPSSRSRFTVSRMAFLLLFALIFSVGQVLLASGLIQNHASSRFWIVSSLIGAGYGAVFSLVPIICSVVWGVENFGTNWGIVAMVPALGATVWGLVYSAVYQTALSQQDWGALTRSPLRNSVGGYGAGAAVDDLTCHGTACYAPTFWAMAISVWVACAAWLWAWRGVDGWRRRGIAV